MARGTAADGAPREVATLRAKLADAEARLADAEETLRAIRSGEVDALVVDGPDGERVFTLVGAERPYRILVEAMNEGAATIDPSGVILYCNARFAEMLQRTLEAVIGSSFRHLVSPRSERALDALIEASVRSGAAKGEVSLDGRERGELPFQLSLCAIPAAPGVLGVVATDLSEVESLRQALRARDDFLSIASHELKTPLAALMLTVDALRRVAQKNPGLPPRFATSLDGAFRQASRLAQLVNDLLDVSRLQAGRVELSLDDTDLLAVARDVVERLLPSSQRARCTVEVRAAGPVLGRWDRDRLERVATNLVSNAIKYGAGAAVVVEVAQRENAARLSVEDHGIGIAPEHQARIFERLERAPNAREFGGLGLGLWICREIVTLHGGTIQVESCLGEGARFVVDLPTAAG
ncbi:MAG: ATP-binding protein [Anaeromyxobacteraceae bacterium]